MTAKKEKKMSSEDMIEMLVQQNLELNAKIEALAKSKEIEKPLTNEGTTIKKGHKLVKARILDADGDLNWGLIEVPESDKRKAFDPNKGTLGSAGNEASVGNPMAMKAAGKNDISVKGL